MAMKLSFNNRKQDFSIALRKTVDQYFATTGLSKTGDSRLFLKTIILLSCAVGLYFLIIFITPSWVTIFLCVLFGLNLACIGFNVMHDGAHGSYSEKNWLNEIMAYSLNLMGGITFLWRQKHNVNHHNFTNIEEHDDDIDIKPIMRTNRNQPHRWFHRFQHIYGLFLYGFTYLSFVFGKNFKEYFSGKIGEKRAKKMDLKEHIIFWVSKLVYFTIFIGIPVYVFGFWPGILGYLLVSFVCGFALGVVFQLAHIVEDTSFPLPVSGSGKIEDDWTIHQLATTANFSTNNKVLSWFLGGLNFQVEHHLFPRISHVHYPRLSKKIREVCRQYGVPYIEYPSLLAALKSHLSYLKSIGQQA